jgi:hypothetical protein
MTCEHLRDLEQALIAKGYAETFRGKAWSDNVREWVYFRVCLNMPAVRERFNLDPCVVDHVYLGTHDGQEAGFECKEHRDGIMGMHPEHCRGVPVFP